MTRKQDTKTPKFRTRENQIKALGDAFYDEWSLSFEHNCKVATKHIIEAEARGAAEQRRKDVEKVEPAGYRHRAYVEVDDYERNVFSGSSTHNWHEDGEGVIYTTTPLYIRPANVEALEAQVKELEEVNKAWAVASANALIWLENGRQANARDELKAAQRRAASIREGSLEKRLAEIEAENREWSIVARKEDNDE